MKSMMVAVWLILLSMLAYQVMGPFLYDEWAVGALGLITFAMMLTGAFDKD